MRVITLEFSAVFGSPVTFGDVGVGSGGGGGKFIIVDGLVVFISLGVSTLEAKRMIMVITMRMNALICLLLL